MNSKDSVLKKVKLYGLFLVLISIFFVILYLCMISLINKISFENSVLDIAEKNNEKIFSIDNITYFSSCNAKADIISNSKFLINNLYQYTDIAIFINNNATNDELSLKNTLKDVYITNISFPIVPETGTPSLYYKNINKFADNKIVKENLLDKEIHFNVSGENETNLDKPTLYNNCANPITLSYVNNNIKKDYSLDTYVNTYDGSLLKKCSVPLTSIECAVSFDGHIINNLEQEFICPLFITIPLKTAADSSIYGGNIILKDSTNYVFYRIK